MTSHVILAFDFGLRRIGVAVGQSITLSANPLSVLIADRGIPKWEQIGQLISQWQPSSIVVGLPVKMDGGEQGISFAARKFALELGQRFRLPVHLVDERLTTREAKRRLVEAGIKLKDYPIDSYAAKIILESWMTDQKKR